MEEIAFSSKDAFGETNEGGSGEDGIDTEDVSGEYSLNTVVVERAASIQRGRWYYIFYKYRMTSERSYVPQNV